VENLTLSSGAGNINGAGNALDNVITGNEGNNVLTGGAGADTFVFAPNFGKDTIADFHPGQDIIQVDHTLFTNTIDLLAHTVDDGLGNAIIAASANDTITVQNTATSMLALHLTDFHFV
jgi:Ca2+-binding RTX toxin-like protein